MSRYNPKNAKEALTYQLEDDVKVLRCLALTSDDKGYHQHLQVLYSHIDIALKRKK